MGRTAVDRLTWLDSNPTLNALAEESPDDWSEVKAELAEIFARRDPAAVKALAERVSVRVGDDGRFLSGERSGHAFEAFVRQQLRARMTHLALRQYAFSSATGVAQGKVRFNLFNGLLAQRLLFERDLVRKPASDRAFRWLWPWLWQKRLLMPLVEKRGIYCFYSRNLVRGLAALIGDRPCVEIAAGDGTLSRFLADVGVQMTATDDHSWSAQVRYPESVKQMDAATALQRLQPKVVLCSWPPSGNAFERKVFRTQSVETYIVIGSRSRFITGNWAEYESQTTFEFTERTDLSSGVLPPELHGGVWVFERKSGPN
ncbi:MAG: hypothetical protein JO142_14630 [Burkholderiales bacterium]|nr:hypothetical protein [Burkholderiales bacterium]